MQALSEMRRILELAGRKPRHGLGQHFLIDGNLMGKLLELAELAGGETVLEVGPGTGALTEELAARAGRVLAVELDEDLAGLLRQRLAGEKKVTVLHGDALAGKHELSPAVLAELKDAPAVHLVANLPYNVAVPIIVNCLLSSWCSLRPAARAAGPAVRFDRLTVTIQKELLERLTAEAGGAEYGPVSVIVALLARATPGRLLPPQAFWPRPKVHSQMLRLDFLPDRAAELIDAHSLQGLLAAVFQQRRKKISAVARLKELPFPAGSLLAALEQAGIDPSLRPQQVQPGQYLSAANALAKGGTA